MDGAGGLIFFVVFIAIFYFLIIMPQSKQAKKRKEMIEALAVGDKIETVSRVFGTITEITGEILTISIGVNGSTKIRIHREGVARVVTDEELSNASSNNKEIGK